MQPTFQWCRGLEQIFGTSDLYVFRCAYDRPSSCHLRTFVGPIANQNACLFVCCSSSCCQDFCRTAAQLHPLSLQTSSSVHEVYNGARGTTARSCSGGAMAPVAPRMVQATCSTFRVHLTVLPNSSQAACACSWCLAAVVWMIFAIQDLAVNEFCKRKGLRIL